MHSCTDACTHNATYPRASLWLEGPELPAHCPTDAPHDRVVLRRPGARARHGDHQLVDVPVLRWLGPAADDFHEHQVYLQMEGVYADGELPDLLDRLNVHVRHGRPSRRWRWWRGHGRPRRWWRWRRGQGRPRRWRRWRRGH